jgi:methyltransferase, FkbM family
MRSVLKGIRDVTADGLASLFFRWPSLEPLLTRTGRLAYQTPLLNLIYRRTRDTLVEKLVARGLQYRRIAFGELQIVMDISEFTTKDYYFSSLLYEPETTRFFLSQLREGEVFIDIGANHGYYTLMAAHLVGDVGKVFAFEPNPQVLAQLKKHISLNEVGHRVMINSLALSDTSRNEVEFFVSNCATNSGLSSLALTESAINRGELSSHNKIMISTSTFDEWLETEKPVRLDLVKIDVEGAEEKVLRGMSKTLATTPPKRIICETTWDSPAHLLLQSYGYSAIPIENGSWGNILYTYESKI